jgi:hypothetical protein
MNPTPDPIEDALRRYRPSGPPASLRDRVLVPPVGRTWPWAAAAAALLAVTLGLQAATGATWQEISAQGHPMVVITPEERVALEDAGVGELAVRVIAEQRAQMQMQIMSGAGQPDGDPPWQ